MLFINLASVKLDEIHLFDSLNDFVRLGNCTEGSKGYRHGIAECHMVKW